MVGIKRAFETVVCENSGWMLQTARRKLRNPDLAEDMVQEALLKAYKAYDTYQEEGKLKPWLMRILQNTLKNYYQEATVPGILSLDYDDEEELSLYTVLEEGISPEDAYIQKEWMDEIRQIISGFPDRQRSIFTCRYLQDLSLKETASRLHIPIGSVKSGGYAAVAKIKTELGLSQPAKMDRRQHKMICEEARKYLFLYAKDILDDQRKTEVKSHLQDCTACRDMVLAMEKLIPTMTYAREDENSHFIIHFPAESISYVGYSAVFSDYQERNRILEQSNGQVPQDGRWPESGFSKCGKLIAVTDQAGNAIAFDIVEEDTRHYRCRFTNMKRVYPYMWFYNVYVEDGSPNAITRSIEAPNLYYGSMHNLYGQPIKSALYQAIPGRAENIRIKRGNGVIDGGSYKFPFVDRYVTAEERISLDYSFLLHS